MADPRMRRADVRWHPAGEGKSAAIRSTSQGNRVTIVDDIEQDLVQSAVTFRTPERHVEAFGRGDRSALVARLHALADGGLLDRAEDILQPREEPSLSIQRVGMPTRARPDTVMRFLRSLSEHAERSARQLEVGIFDQGDAAQSATMAARLTEKLPNLTVRHFHEAHRKLVVERFTRATGADPAIVAATLLGDVSLQTYRGGANYNSILLWGASQGCISSFDDDVVLRLAPSPGLTPGVRMTGRRDPTRIRWYPDRDAAFAAHPTTSVDPISLHESVIGKSLQGLVAAHGAWAGDWLDTIPPNAFGTTAGANLRCQIASIGALGDTGTENSHYAMTVEGLPHTEAARTEASWRVARTARNVFRCAEALTLAHGAHFMSMAFAEDLRGFFAPFAPGSRATDTVHVILTRLSSDSACVAHLPWATMHDPPERRVWDFDAPSTGTTILRFYELILWIARGVTLPALAPPELRLALIGKALVEHAQLPGPVFVDYVNTRWANRCLDVLKKLDDRLASAPPWVAADLRRTMEQLRASMARAPLDSLQVEPLAEAQAVIGRIGRIAQIWPAMIAAARDGSAFEL